MLKRILVNFAIKILESEVLSKIQYAPTQNFLKTAVETLKESANIVLDGDPNNKEQFAELWQKEKETIVIGAIDTASAVITAEVKDPTAVKYITSLLEEIRREIEAGNVLKPAA